MENRGRPRFDAASIQRWGEWLYNLLKPRTHNRIALICIVAGVSILISPLWEPVLRALLQEWFSLSVDPPTSPAFGITLTAIGLLYHYAAMKVDASENARQRQAREEKARAHDVKLAAHFRTLCSEQVRDALLSDLLNVHLFFKDDLARVEDGARFLCSAEGHFITPAIREKAASFARAFGALRRFLSLHFYIHPENQKGPNFSFAMHPHWNVDRGGSGSAEDDRKYGEVEDQLEALVDAFSDEYDSLIQEFHERLFE